MVFKLPRHSLPPPLALCKLGNIFSFTCTCTFTSCLWYSKSLTFISTSCVKHLPTQIPSRREGRWAISGMKKGQESSSSWTAWAERVWIDRTNLHLLTPPSVCAGESKQVQPDSNHRNNFAKLLPLFPCQAWCSACWLIKNTLYQEKTLLCLNAWRLGQ